jgi:hypothetical protein
MHRTRLVIPTSESDRHAGSPILCLTTLFRLGDINSGWPALGFFSCHFDILDILVSLSKYFPLVFILDSSSLWDWEWFLAHLLEWLHLMALGDCYNCGVLVTLGGCRHLDGLKQRWRSDTCWWLFVSSSSDLWEVLVPSWRSAKDNSSGLLVSLSYHTCGRFLRCSLRELGFGFPISYRTTRCWSTQRGLACWWAREPQEKNRMSSLWLIHWISPGDWYSSYCDWFIPRRGGIKITFLLFTFPQTSCNKLFSVISFESLSYLC